MFDVIAFDADDTLWHTEAMFNLTQEKFKQLLAGYRDGALIEQKLYETEMRNLHYFGYGIKGFTLAMIETAVELTAGQIRGRDIQQIIDFAREMRRFPVELLEHVKQTVALLAESYPLMLITKGELIDQESKIARSGIAHCFRHVEVVSDKTQETYASVLAKRGIDIGRFLMIGNSLRSDILPVVALGGQAVYIPYHTTWAHETVSDHENPGGYHELEHIGQLPALIEQLSRQT